MAEKVVGIMSAVRNSQDNEIGQSSSSSPRKRPLPSSLLNEDEAPPNKRIHIPTVRELYYEL